MQAMASEVRVLSFYLPQYHPIPENDLWWGKGFTEWSNVTQARPLFRGHHQPNLPADLGFYDLRVPEVREMQSQLALDHGVDGFCYWHYWFGNGKRLLERPFDEVLHSGKPAIPFCLAWANQTWTGIWHGLKDHVLITQEYPGEDDQRRHFYHLLPAFQDERYIKIDNKPLFVVYIPDGIPETKRFTALWNELAVKNGFNGIYFVGIHYMGWDHLKDGFDAKTIHQPSHYVFVHQERRKNNRGNRLTRLLAGKKPNIFSYPELIDTYDFSQFRGKDFIPTIIPNWDNTPRSKYSGWVFQGSSPELFKQHFRDCLDYVMNHQQGEKIIFIKSWNEWAEGNYLEPDQRWGRSYLEAIREVRNSCNV